MNLIKFFIILIMSISSQVSFSKSPYACDPRNDEIKGWEDYVVKNGFILSNELYYYRIFSKIWKKQIPAFKLKNPHIKDVDKFYPGDKIQIQICQDKTLVPEVKAILLPVTVNNLAPEYMAVYQSQEDFLLPTQRIVDQITKLNLEVPASLTEHKTTAISFAELQSLGFQAFYNELKVQIEIYLPSKKTVIEFSQPDPAQSRYPIIKPEPISGYVNNSTVIGYRSNLDQKMIQTPIQSRFDGVLNIYGYVLEASGYFRDNNPFVRDDIRITKEYEILRGSRLSIGDLEPAIKGFQSYRKLGGISFYSVNNSNGLSSNNIIELKDPSTLTFIVNDKTLLTRNFIPGTYDLSEIPLNTGNNVITVQIQSLITGELRIIHYEDFFSNAGIKKGYKEFNISLGDTVIYQLQDRAYNSDQRTLSLNFRYDLNNKYSTTSYFQADHNTQMLGLIQAIHVIGGRVELDVAESNYLSIFGTAFKFAYYKTEPNTFSLIKGDRFNFIYEKRLKNFANLDFQQIFNSERYSVTYSVPLNLAYYGTLGYSEFYSDLHNDLSKTYSLTLTRSVQALSITGTLSHTDSILTRPDTNIGITLNWTPNERSYSLSNFSGGGTNTTYLSTNSTQQKGVNGNFMKSSDNSSSTYTTQVTAITEKNEMSLVNNQTISNITSNYNSNQYAFSNRFSISFAGNNWAFGRPISDSFFISKTQSYNKDYKIRAMGKSAETTIFGEALLSTYNYDTTIAQSFSKEKYSEFYDVNETFIVNKSFKNGYIINFKNFISPTIIEVKTNKLEELANSLINFKNIETSIASDFYINDKGKIFLEGIESGEYEYMINDIKGKIILQVEGGHAILEIN